MRLVTFTDSAGARAGLFDPDQDTIIDLSAITTLPRDVLSIIELGDDARDELQWALSSGNGRLRRSAAILAAPIPRPARNILCVGKNYHAHAQEFHQSGFDASAGKEAVPDLPIIFTKWPSTVIAPGQPIPASSDPSQSTDYEGELTVVIGRQARRVSAKDAFHYVYGYTIINDVTARTLQNQHKQWFLGKSLDGFCPMGPSIVTADEIPDVGALSLQTRVNGELRQDARVSELIFDIPSLIATITALMTLEPGDLIATGTCAGVGIGFKPPRFLRPGDTVDVTIDAIGTLTNPVC